MPVAKKQQAPQAQVTLPPSGSILSRAVPVSQVKEQYQKVVIYGTNRTGKTTTACEWPKPLLLVSFEPGRTGGAVSVSKVPNVDFIQVDSTEMALGLAKELPGSGYNTVVVDSASSMQEMILRELMGWTEERTQLSFGSVSKEVYQQRSERTRDLLRPYLDAQTHTIVICHEKDHNPPQDGMKKLNRGLQIQSFIAPAIGGATVEWLMTNCGYICRMYVARQTRIDRVPSGIKDENDKDVFNEVEVDTGVDVRRLLTLPQQNFAAGMRSATPDVIPEWIEGRTPSELYQKFQKLVRGEKVR